MTAKECGRKMFRAYRYFLEKIEYRYKATLILNKCDDVYYDSILNELYDDIRYRERNTLEEILEEVYKFNETMSKLSVDVNASEFTYTSKLTNESIKIDTSMYNVDFVEHYAGVFVEEMYEHVDDLDYIELYSNDKLIDVLYKEIMYDLKSHISAEINERYYLSARKRLELEHLCTEAIHRAIKVVSKIYRQYKISTKGV